MTALQGLRVVEWSTDPSGEMTGLQLAHLGAVVERIEPPTGAESRHHGPFVDGVADPEKSLAFWFYNVGKRSVVLDVEGSAFRDRLNERLVDADVFLCNVHPTELDRLGIDLNVLRTLHPRLVVLSITPFGLTGPWRNYLSSDLVGMAASGLLITSGYDDHSIPPIRPGGDQTFHTAASFALIAGLLALTERSNTGEGGLVDVSMHESAGLTVELANPFWFYPQVVVQRQTCRHAQPVPTQLALFACGDGGYLYFAFIVAEQKAWLALVQWMVDLDVAVDLDDEKYLDVKYRQQNFAHIQEVMEVFFLLQNAHEAYHEGQRRGLPMGVLNAPEDLFDDAHMGERGFFASVDQPGHGTFVTPGPVMRFSAYDPVTVGPAPSLGEHTVP